MTKRKKEPPAAVFKTVKQATAYADKMRAKDPYRYSANNLAVLDHPKERGRFAIGLMAAGCLLYGYVPQSTGRKIANPL